MQSLMIQFNDNGNHSALLDSLEIETYHQNWEVTFQKTFLELINIISEAYIQ